MSNAETRSNSGMTVAEALADRAAELRVLIDWAAVRLDRARSLVALATEPARPGDTPDLYGSAAALDLAGELLMDVGEEAKDAKSPYADERADVETMALQAQEALLSTMPADDWEPEHVAGMTVAALTAALKAETAAEVRV